MEKKGCSTESIKEIFEIAKSISSVLDVDVLLRRISAVAEKIIDAEASSIMLLDEDKEHLSFKLATGEKGGVVGKMRINVGDGIAGTAAKEKKPLIVNDVSKDNRFNSEVDKVSGYVTKSILCVPMFMDEELLGVVEILNKRNNANFTDEDKDLLENTVSLAATSINNARIAEDNRNFFVNMIEILITAIEGRDQKLIGHSWNVAQLATTLGRHLGLKNQDYRNLYYGALLHDIGLINIKGGLSIFEGVITVRERDPETNHPRIGAEMVRNINLLSGAVPVIRHHHENFDGTGYPDGLSGDKIPLAARIVAVAEVVEEMRLSGFNDDRIRQMLKLGQETRFDPQVVGIYLKEFSEAKV